jgi:hypothetical protein
MQLPLTQVAGLSSGQLSWLVDLAAVFLGWGAIMAHEQVGDQLPANCCGGGPESMISRLPPRTMGYALALFAHARGELRPQWNTSLRLDAQAMCTRSLKYLHRTNDTLFSPETAGRSGQVRSTAELLAQLQTGSPSARVAALWELRAECHASEAAEPICAYLHDRRPEFREEAAKTLASYGSSAGCALPDLLELLEDRHRGVRAAAAHAVGCLEQTDEAVLDQLAPLLRDLDREVVFGAAVSVEKFGESALPAARSVLDALRAAIIRCDRQLIDALTDCLVAMDPDPTDRVMEYFGDDLELRQQVVHIMVDALGAQGDADIA